MSDAIRSLKGMGTLDAKLSKAEGLLIGSIRLMRTIPGSSSAPERIFAAARAKVEQADTAFETVREDDDLSYFDLACGLTGETLRQLAKKYQAIPPKAPPDQYPQPDIEIEEFLGMIHAGHTRIADLEGMSELVAINNFYDLLAENLLSYGVGTKVLRSEFTLESISDSGGRPSYFTNLAYGANERFLERHTSGAVSPSRAANEFMLAAGIREGKEYATQLSNSQGKHLAAVLEDYYNLHYATFPDPETGRVRDLTQPPFLRTLYHLNKTNLALMTAWQFIEIQDARMEMAHYGSKEDADTMTALWCLARQAYDRNKTDDEPDLKGKIKVIGGDEELSVHDAVPLAWDGIIKKAKTSYDLMERVAVSYHLIMFANNLYNEQLIDEKPHLAMLEEANALHPLPAPASDIRTIHKDLGGFGGDLMRQQPADHMQDATVVANIAGYVFGREAGPERYFKPVF